MSSRNITSASNKAGSPKAQGISYHAFRGTLAAAVDKAVVPEGELERSLGLDLHSLSPSDRVPVELVQQLWARLEAVATTTDYGLIIGQYISPDTKGLLASWVSQCKSLGEALRVFVQNSVLMSQLECYSLKERDGLAVVIPPDFNGTFE
ncbi:AraC family transcriptional regulator ligand-binding domain-containing protein [Allohahella sp. A8]|uniref:AraC family transcriptional regulator ligand-binding domain-containing protein n=1 Tax=Allohahella sp. A8 TaxID=3141461 RepID=UPI003A7FB033